MIGSKWFELMFKIKENKDTIHDDLQFKDGFLRSRFATFKPGEFKLVSSKDFKISSIPNPKSTKSTIKVIVGDVRELLQSRENSASLFQVASQFNCLEFINPNKVPEDGISCYGFDNTQGPICAIAAGAGTCVRNYFVDVEGKQGQSINRQINCLQRVEQLLGINVVKNGYFIANERTLLDINEKLKHINVNEIQDGLQIGVQKDTQIVFDKDYNILDYEQIVCQAFCSSFAIGYTNVALELWKPLTMLVLKASYRLVFLQALEGNKRLFLTLVGGGVFRNPIEWILEAIEGCFREFKDFGLEIIVVLYKRDDAIERFINNLNQI